MPATAWAMLVMAGVLSFIAMGSFVFMIRFFRKTNGDQAIVRTGFGGTVVDFNGLFVIPSLHQAVTVPITIQKLRYERSGEWALTFGCGSKVELIADFDVRVNKTMPDVECAVASIGVERLNSPELLREYFESMFNDCLDTIALQSSFAELARDKDAFREKMLKNIGTFLEGVVICDLSLHHLRRV